MLARIWSSIAGKLGAIFLLAALAFWMSLGLKIGSSLPAHALVLVNFDTGTYVTGPCVLHSEVEDLFVLNLESFIAGTENARFPSSVISMTKAEAVALGMKGDRVCANADGFVEFASWPVAIFGLAKNRVDSDGTVLW